MKRVLFLLLFLLPGISLFAHAVDYKILSRDSLKIEVVLGGGEKMAGAEVLVFPPGSLEAEYRLKTGDDGCFYLTPDRTGTWILQVRGERGHAVRINLDVDEEMKSAGAPGGSSLTLIQKLIMVLAVGWGSIGTALYFKGRNTR